MKDEMRDVVIIAHPAATTLVDATELSERGVRRAVHEAVEQLTKEGVDRNSTFNVGRGQVPLSTLEHMRNGSELRVVHPFQRSQHER